MVGSVEQQSQKHKFLEVALQREELGSQELSFP